MRRFCWRPSGVSLEAMGKSSSACLASTAWPARRSHLAITAAAARARAFDSWKFDGNFTVWIGWLSDSRQRPPGRFRAQCRTNPMPGRAVNLGSTTALP